MLELVSSSSPFRLDAHLAMVSSLVHEKAVMDVDKGVGSAVSRNAAYENFASSHR